jgi:hypothetical protein
LTTGPYGIVGRQLLSKKDEVFLHQWLINPRISHGIDREKGLLEDWDKERASFSRL